MRIALLVLLVAGCDVRNEWPVATLTGVEPDWTFVGQARDIRISGENLHADLRTDVKDSGVRVRTGFSGALGGEPLDDLEWQNSSTLTATTPALGAGTFDLSVVLPDGRRVELERAVDVVEPPDDVIVASGNHDEVTMPDGAQNIDVAVPPVDPSRTILFYNCSGTGNDPNSDNIGVQFLDDGTIRFERDERYDPTVPGWFDGDILISFALIEFASGVRVQRGRTVTTPNQFPYVGAVSIDAVDPARTFILATSYYRGYSFGDDDWAQVYLSDATTMTIELRGTGALGARVDWQVVEVDAATVQSGNVMLTGTELTVPISQVNRDQSFLIFTHQGFDVPMSQMLINGQLAPLSVRFEREAVGPDVPLSYFVVEWPGTHVETGLVYLNEGSPSIESGWAGPPVDVDRSATFVPGFMRQGTSSYTADDVPGTGWYVTRLTSPQFIEVERAAPYGNSFVTWTVVEFPP